ncbi:MAG TPA: ribonuclease P protein component, partial [Candidatus Acetothermia bacterium]|nr:ribonuclease P protein component [Candidatus Acetothermia bacterium]
MTLISPGSDLGAEILSADAGEARVLAMDDTVGYSFRMCNGEDCRFPAWMRLKRQTDFERVFRQGRTWRGKHFQFRVLVTLQEARMGISVSRRYGNAV